MTGRVLFHVQHLLGIGHLQRSLRIAEALAARGIAVTLAQGGPPVSMLNPVRGIEIIQLPPIRARDATFALVDSKSRPVDDALRGARRDRLLAAFADIRPDAVVIEGFPFARRAFRFELDPLIEAAREARAPVIATSRPCATIRPATPRSSPEFAPILQWCWCMATRASSRSRCRSRRQLKLPTVCTTPAM
jgi:predicted glycosyltransferase